MGSSHGLPSFRKIKSASIWALHRLQFLQEVPTCSGVGSSMDGSVVDVRSGIWRSTFSSFSDLGLPSAVLHSFCSLIASLQLFLPFLKYISAEVPTAWLRDSSMPCCGAIGAIWNWHGAALASPRALLCYQTLPFTPSIFVKEFSTVKRASVKWLILFEVKMYWILSGYMVLHANDEDD